MKLTHLLLTALCAGTLLSGCKGKDGDPGPAGPAGAQGPAGPSGQLSGSMVGFVEANDEFGRPQSKSGFVVSLENVTPAVSTTTDANGRYELTNVKSGTYTIAFNKAGYGTYKIQGYPHAGGTQPAFLYTRYFTAISATTVTSFTLGPIQAPGQNVSDYTVPIYLSLANPNQPTGTFRRLSGRVFVGTSPTVTATTGVAVGSAYFDGQVQTDNYVLSRNNLNSYGFATGSTAYVVVYGAPDYQYSNDDSYTDPLTGRRVLTSLNATPSQVLQFIVP